MDDKGGLQPTLHHRKVYYYGRHLYRIYSNGNGLELCAIALPFALSEFIPFHQRHD